MELSVHNRAKINKQNIIIIKIQHMDTIYLLII